VILREGIGFQLLTPKEQQAYKIMLQAFSLMATSINCAQFFRDIDLVKVINIALGDNPSVIYFDKTKLEIEQSFNGKRILFTGVHSKSQAEKMNFTLDDFSNKIISYVKTRITDEYSLLIKLYEVLQRNIIYDKNEIQAISNGVSQNPTSHNAYGALVNRSAVCDGFSSAFTLLAQKLGFECMLVVGRSDYATTLQDHAWNIIKVGKEYYHLDITWDTRKYNEFDEFSYAYFALTDTEIINDHNWNSATTPVCSSRDFSYYVKNGLYANTTTELSEIVKTHGRKNVNVFRIKLDRNIKLPNNAGDYLVQMVLNEVIKPGERKQASYSWDENSRCFFVKIL